VIIHHLIQDEWRQARPQSMAAAQLGKRKAVSKFSISEKKNCRREINWSGEVRVT